MSASVSRVGTLLGVDGRAAWLATLSGLAGIAALVAVATRLGMLPILLALVLAGLATIAGFRWPLLPLLLFVALIPIEEIVVIDGFGTLSRAAGVLFAVTYGAPRLGRLALPAMPRAAWAYLAWAIASLAWAVDPSTTWGELATLMQLFLVAVLVADFVVERPTIVRPVLWVYSISATATALIGIQAYLAQGIAVSRAAAVQDQDPAQFAAVLIPALVFGLYEMLNGRRRPAGAVVALLTTIGVVVSGTRGAWIAIGVALLFIFAELSPKRRVAAIVAMLAFALILYQVPGVRDLIDQRAGSALSTGGEGRTDIWSVAALIYRSAPVLGVGYANFPVVYTLDLVRTSGVSSLSAYVQGRGAHDVLVATGVELGPIGVLVLVLFLAPLILRRGWGPDAATVRTALASLITMALFLDIVGNRKQVWLVIGLAAGLTLLARRHRAAPAKDERAPRPSRGPAQFPPDPRPKLPALAGRSPDP